MGSSQITGDIEFKNIMEKHVREVISYLLAKEQTFSILCNYALVDFDPILPDDITSGFKPLTLFAIAGYTYESLTLDEEYLYFEAGFGPQNLGSFVSVPLFAILQIVVEDNVLLVNLTAGHEEFKYKKIEDEGIRNSMEALLSNPENLKFIKNKKK